MTNNLTEKLIDKLCEIALVDATSKTQWKKYCESAKKGDIQTNYQILYSVVEINEFARKNNYAGADNITLTDPMFETKANIETAKKGLKLLKHSKLYLQSRLISEASLKAKDKEKWNEFCNTLASEERYYVVEQVVGTLDKIKGGKDSFLKVKKEVISNSEYVSHINQICDGLKHFKIGNDFARFLKEKRNILTCIEKKPYKKPHTHHV